MTERYNSFNNSRTEQLRGRGVRVDGPHDMLNSQEAFAKPVETIIEPLSPGVNFEQSSLILSEVGDFTNRYRVVFDDTSPKISFNIDVKNNPVHVQRSLANDEEVVCAINGGFFLLVDDRPESPPKEMMFGTLIKNSVQTGFSSHDRPVLWVDHEGDLHVTEVSARGLVSIEGMTSTWTGYRSNQPRVNLTLFGSDSCVVTHEPDPETGKKRVIDEEMSKTPKRTDLVDIICAEKDGQLVVVEIKEGGGTPVTAGNFILQGNTSILQTVSVGQLVNISCNDLEVEKISGAITIGPSVAHFDNEDDHPQSRSVVRRQSAF